MDEDLGELAHAIGARVRHERQTRRWTLDQLATTAGLSRRLVVNVEQGATNPSVGTLLRLSEALGVGLPTLVEPPRDERLTVTPAGQGAALWSGERGGRGVLVAATRPPDVVELWHWTLEPGERHASPPHAAGTRELVHLHEGTLVLEAGGETATLHPGDAATFDGDTPHAYAAPADRNARFSLTVFEPSTSPRTRTEPTHD
ncbi:XRE family transcriptional regulator [Sanguibacter sp. 25GB23B1]|uniref:helix-turn-helix domain-containing protein n=1 Tax=unclassified Sanguibacter TaxID=2645534 RepID=UPI0032AF276D